MRPIVTDVLWSVSACPLVTTRSCTKTAEPIEMLFRLWTWVDPMNHGLGGGPEPPRERAFFWRGASGSRVVSVLDSGAEVPVFKSQPRRCRVTVLGKLFIVHTHRASIHQAAKLIATLLRVAGVTAGLAESNGSLPPRL